VSSGVYEDFSFVLLVIGLNCFSFLVEYLKDTLNKHWS